MSEVNVNFANVLRTKLGITHIVDVHVGDAERQSRLDLKVKNMAVDYKNSGTANYKYSKSHRLMLSAA